MKFHILIIKNRTPSLDSYFETYLNWIRKFTPLEPEIKYITSDIDLAHKSFGISKEEKELYGLSGVKDQVKDLIEENSFNLVLFVYNVPMWDDNKQLCAWTYPSLLKGAAFVEIPERDVWNYGLVRMLCHETIHAFHRILWHQGIPSRDTMDSFSQDTEADIPGGNFYENLERIKPYWDKVATLPRNWLIVSILRGLVQAYELLISLRKTQEIPLPKPEPPKPELPKKNRLEEWAHYIEKYENMDKSYNNPGALRFSIFQNGTRRGFATFETYAVGKKALLYQLEIACTGKSKVYTPEDTLLTFYKKYCEDIPETKIIEPYAYALYIASQLKVDPQTKIKDLYA